jgi:hypothetical protein
VRRTRATTLIGLGLVGVVIGFLLEMWVVAGGLPVLVPPVSLPITLIAIAAVVLILAVPIRRAVLGRTKTRIDPFHATRVAVLAKASSLAGALLTGSGIGILAYELSRPVLPAVSSVWLAGAATFGAAVLLAAGLVAERMCTLPPPGDDDAVHAHDHA